MQFGFSYVGLIFLLMLMVPNIIWTKNQPKDYDQYVGKETMVRLVVVADCRICADGSL